MFSDGCLYRIRIKKNERNENTEENERQSEGLNMNFPNEAKRLGADEVKLRRERTCTGSILRIL
jgi:hypothetical protein